MNRISPARMTGLTNNRWEYNTPAQEQNPVPWYTVSREISRCFDLDFDLTLIQVCWIS